MDDADAMKCIRMLTFLPLEQIDEMSTWKDQRLNEAKEILAYEDVYKRQPWTRTDEWRHWLA